MTMTHAMAMTIISSCAAPLQLPVGLGEAPVAVPAVRSVAGVATTGVVDNHRGCGSSGGGLGLDALPRITINGKQYMIL